MRIYVRGDRVWQPTYGTGTVIEADSLHTIIDFDDHGLRKFSTPIVKLCRTDVPAPDRPTPKPRSKRAVKARTQPAATTNVEVGASQGGRRHE